MFSETIRLARWERAGTSRHDLAALVGRRVVRLNRLAVEIE
jgi:hypothetical protein